MESWAAELASGRADAAWDLFLDRYRRLIFAAIRHYAQDYDDVMDIFARVCEALREDDLARLRCYAEQPFHGARFSTWLDRRPSSDDRLVPSPQRDRKSTRLNSIHVETSYAAFC